MDDTLEGCGAIEAPASSTTQHQGPNLCDSETLSAATPDQELITTTRFTLSDA